MPSRRNICSNVRLTDVVPAPEEPVTEMMGCLTDTILPRPNIGFSNEQSTPCEQRGCLALRNIAAMISLDSLHFLARTEHQRYALMQEAWRAVEYSLAAIGSIAASLLDQEGDRVCFVKKAQAAAAIAGP